MKTKQATKLWESLGKTLIRIEKHNAHKIDVDSALQQIRDLYIEILKLESNNQDDENSNNVRAHFASETQEYIETKKPVDISVETTDSKTITEEENKEKDIEIIEHIEQIEVSEKSDRNINIENIEQAKPIEETTPKSDFTSIDSSELITEKVSTPQLVDRESQNNSIETEKTPLKSETNTQQSEQTDLFQNTETKQKGSLGEVLGKDRRSVNDIISSNHGENLLASKLKSKPITDIKSAINLGDRFLFIKELFRGNADDFNQTIKDLNNQQSYEDAVNYLEKYNWSNDNKTVQNFQSIVQRRFISNN